MALAPSPYPTLLPPVNVSGKEKLAVPPGWRLFAQPKRDSPGGFEPTDTGRPGEGSGRQKIHFSAQWTVYYPHLKLSDDFCLNVRHLIAPDIHRATADALPGILKELKERGFHVVQVVPAPAAQF
jgi:hypothetical protein